MKSTFAIACAILTALGSTTARAETEPDPKRRVAVLEFRSGSAELPGLDERIAEILGKTTSLQVIDASAARRSYGEHLDRDLVECAGKAGCVAGIGRKLGAIEVLLVGVSEFGDVILTLQRIRAEDGKVLTRIAEALAPGEPPGDTTVRRYLGRVMPESDFIRYGIIRINANVEGAAVAIDARRRGQTPVEPIRVRAPASYEIQVAKEGFVTFTATVKVPPDGDVNVRTVLTRRTDESWYTKWWVAAIAGTVVVGAATAVVLMTRGEPEDVPVVIPPFEGVGFRF